MTLETLRNHCLSLEDVTEDQPFGENTLCFRIGGKIFAITDFLSDPPSVNLKNDPEKNIQLREEHDCVIPGFHMNKKHWNTVHLDSSISDILVKEWVEDSYRIIKSSLPKKKK